MANSGKTTSYGTSKRLQAPYAATNSSRRKARHNVTSGCSSRQARSAQRSQRPRRRDQEVARPGTFRVRHQ